MARKALVDDEELLRRLTVTFRDVGYEAASLALLSEATGLKKASLYHRFPGGKEQMAREVMQEAGRWLTEYVLGPLSGPGSPEQRIADMARQLNGFYQGGKQACLLNLLSSPVGREGPFKAAIKQMFEAFISALARVVAESGFPADIAHARAERAIALVQGSLVLARGLGSHEPFQRALEVLPTELLAEDSTTTHRRPSARPATTEPQP